MSDVLWLNDLVRSIAQREPQRKIVILSRNSPIYDGIAMDPKHAEVFAHVGIFYQSLHRRVMGESECQALGIWPHTLQL